MTLTRTIASAIIFSAVLACAGWTVLIHLDASGGGKLLEETCPPRIVKTFGQTYGTGIEPVDTLLCGMVSFFQTSLQHPVKDFITIFLFSGPIISFVLLLESSRSDRPYVASLPILFGVITQLFTAAVATSLFWALFVVQACFSGTKRGRKPVTRAGVEAAILAVLIGYWVPTLWMLITHDAWAIVLWQPFPLYMSIVQNAWLFIRRNQQSGSAQGADLAQAAMLGFSLLGAVSWYWTLLPYASMNAPWDFLEWLPSWSVPDPKTNTLSATVLHLLQYDMLWMLVSTIIAAMFLYEDTEHSFFIVQAAPTTIALLGPAALIGGIWMFREWDIVTQEYNRQLNEKYSKKD